MSKNVTWIIILIVVVTFTAVFISVVGTLLSIHIFTKVLRPGIDEVGGYALVYEIDSNGLTEEQKTGLSEKTMVVLRKRIDPKNIYNIVWRPLGNTRFEIQMPLASEKAREKRQAYETALNEVLVNNATVAPQNLNNLNLSENQVTSILDMAAPGSTKRAQSIDALKKEFPEREKQIDVVVQAYDTYYPFRGRLDNPNDLQRMLKGAGILEFRILPAEGSPKVDMAQMKNYVDNLKMKGPKDSSDDAYIWFEIDNPQQWRGGITEQFENKLYVLASNKKDECMLHNDQMDWRLVRASPGQDQMGRRAIDFELDERGGKLFSNITGKNLERPLCILLNNTALSAPNIQSRIYTRGQITGSYSITEVEDMVDTLNAGRLPAKLVEEPVSFRTIAPRSRAKTTQ